LTKRILVVDDEPTIRDLVSDALREAGYQVDAAANGAEALRIMRRRVPHAIVLDLMMPRLDATGFVEMQRLNPRLAGIPVLVVTAAYGAHEAAERLGADACLTKPFELDDLVNAIDRLVGNARPEHTPEASASNAGLQPSTVAPR
jgi:two-component system OmpR family response regulator